MSRSSTNIGGGVVYDPGAWRIRADGQIYRRGKIKHANGDLYDGEFLNHKRHGKGSFHYANGNLYQGEFEEGLYHGFGVLTTVDVQHPLTKKYRRGEKYEGQFVRGQKEGDGFLTTSKGNYEGSFAHNKFSGKGTYSYKTGLRYSGDWLAGKWHGKGEILYPDGAKYIGEVNMMHRHGQGSFVYGHNRGRYTGSFIHNQFHGYGERVYMTGASLSGTWVYGVFEGEGTLVNTTDIKSNSGSKYIGDFQNGHPCGDGIYLYADGSKYEGSVHRSLYFGKGSRTYSDGGSYEGEFIKTKPNTVRPEHPFPNPDGLANGHGRRVWSNGSVYTGPMTEGKMGNGIGILISKQGLVYEGSFLNGAQTGQAVLRMEDTTKAFEFPPGSKIMHQGKGECRYEGGVLNGAFHGQGKFQYLDGRYYRGQWSRGKRHGRGEQNYVATNEEGIADRQFIGKGGTLYRVARYSGDWVEDVKHGHGRAYFSNGESIVGPFRNGWAHGICTYIFKSTRRRKAEFRNGTRVSWLNGEDSVPPPPTCSSTEPQEQ